MGEQQHEISDLIAALNAWQQNDAIKTLVREAISKAEAKWNSDHADPSVTHTQKMFTLDDLKLQCHAPNVIDTFASEALA